ncbi:Tripartite ATP-independent periplasmic transporter, DctQ component [Devosia sp. LC5]|uniref:TRAP transporter small permease n=1 Tax=Devosia sp. LC5 TaxID=1502724 RepID=UPI0004E309E4|nr:TRAP transporter small permease [Devosia sp. LC5]KFC69508.1 Tripartite ATP-independent periplasmic transporter, DctQ component [Devosia sp. LC5]
MKSWLLPTSRILGRLSNAILWLAGIGLVSMTVIVAYQVFMRFVINASPSWTEAGAIMLMTWFIFLGAAVGVRENFHMGFDALLQVLPPSAKPWLRGISDVAIFCFAFGMVWYGGGLAIRFWSTRIPVLGLPTSFTYFPIVVSGALMCLFALERFLLRLAGEPVDDIAADPTITEA